MIISPIMSLEKMYVMIFSVQFVNKAASLVYKLFNLNNSWLLDNVAVLYI